jgi:manganese transport protein
MFRLPTFATAPFCPSEVRGTVAVPAGIPAWRKLLRFVGPGLLVSVGYIDPGNWATDIEAGSKFGDDLLFVVLSSLTAIILQCLTMRLGLVARKDLARLSRESYGRRTTIAQWLFAESRLSPAISPKFWAALSRSSCSLACRSRPGFF